MPPVEIGTDLWIDSDFDPPRLGVTPGFAASFSARWVALELPEAGQRIEPGDVFGFAVTAAGTLDLRTPAGFRVAGRNAAALENPQLAKLSPMGAGWLLEIERKPAAAAPDPAEGTGEGAGTSAASGEPSRALG